jgi:Ca-activated chloride channel family protein
VPSSTGSLTEALKFLIPAPIPLPISGRRLAPKIKMMITRMISISGSPIGPKSAKSPMSYSLSPVAAILLILALTSTKPAAARPDLPEQPTFTAGVTQVEVYATVTDAEGRAVKGLTQSDFVVLENDQPQAIKTFVGGEFPAAVALAIDRSFSMKGAPLTIARTAGRGFVASLKNDDRAMLISISGEVEVLAPLSADKATVLRALDSLDPWSTTSLNDALIRSIDLLEGETGRRAIVLLSDGADRYSTASDGDVVTRARSSDAMIYPIAIGKQLPSFFVEIAAISGGRSFHLRNPEALQPTLEAIASDLRAQYLIGYEPTIPVGRHHAEWRSIAVKVGRPGLRVRARSGYSTK